MSSVTLSQMKNTSIYAEEIFMFFFYVLKKKY